MPNRFPSAEEYAQSSAGHAPMTVVDIRAMQTAITGDYTNKVLLDVNQACMRLAVFEGQYRWHRHPESDELFLVVAGELHIEFQDGRIAVLTEWQCLVVPAGCVHRTRAVGRTVNLTFESREAATEFLD